MTDKIVKLKELGCMFVTIGEIPSSYKISMTYEEQLLWLCNYLEKTIIPAINTNADILEKVKEEYDKFDSQYDELNEKINNLRNYVNASLEAMNDHINLELTRTYNQVIELMNEYQLLFTNQLNQAINELNERINNIEIGQINVYNPTSGRIENINKVLNDIYDSVRYDALTVNEFEGLNYTSSGFDAVEITAYNFDNNGKSILS